MKGLAPPLDFDRASPRSFRAANLPPLDFQLDQGLHALVGTPADGTLAVAKLAAGLETCASGRITVMGGDPARNPALRKRVGATLDTPVLPAAGRVRGLLARVDALRGEPLAAGALERLGLSHLGDRKVGDLSRREARAVELVLAISTPDPAAILLTEPGADMAPLDRQALREALARAAAAGASVVAITASMSDAVELSDTVHLLERGEVTRYGRADQTGRLVPGRGMELRVEVDLPRVLVAALADDPNVIGIDWDQHGRRSMLTIRGEDLDQLALSIARAAVAGGANVRSMAPIAPGLDEVRAAASGLAMAAYHAAYHSSYRPPRGPGPASGSSGGAPLGSSPIGPPWTGGRA